MLQHMDCVPPLDEVHEALRSVCSQWSTASSTQRAHRVEYERKNKDAIMAG